MKIGPTITEKAVQICTDIEKAAKEVSTKEVKMEEAHVELPRMSLETVMPKKSIIKSQSKINERNANIKKLIDEFNDINDTETITKICQEWERDLQDMYEKFTTGHIPKDRIYEEHRKSLEQLDIYEQFCNKIFDATKGSETDSQRAMEIFDKHIQPRIIKSQEIMHTVDNIPEVKKSYIRTSENVSKENELSDQTNQTTSATTTTEVSDPKPAPIPPQPQIKIPEIKDKPETVLSKSIEKELLADIEAMTDLNSASKLIFSLQKQKGALSTEKYEQLSNMVINKMNSLK